MAQHQQHLIRSMVKWQTLQAGKRKNQNFEWAGSKGRISIFLVLSIANQCPESLDVFRGEGVDQGLEGMMAKGLEGCSQGWQPRLGGGGIGQGVGEGGGWRGHWPRGWRGHWPRLWRGALAEGLEKELVLTPL